MLRCCLIFHRFEERKALERINFLLCLGITRDNFEGRRVSLLSYEAYEPMALQELNRLCDDARRKFTDIKHIAICHRLGLVFNQRLFIAVEINNMEISAFY